MLGGGVMANKELQKQFIKKIKELLPDTKYYVPLPEYCTDNALMVAVAGYFKSKKKKSEKWEDIEANANLGLK